MNETDFRSVINLKCFPSNKCRHFRIASTIAYASFSTDECFYSAEVRVLEKKATGRPFWVREAAIACSEASVSI